MTRKSPAPAFRAAAVAAVAAAAVAAVAALAGGGAFAAGGGVALVVDGRPLDAETFSAFLQEEKAATIARFRRDCGAEYGPGFWERRICGETPLDYAKDRAFSKAVAFMVERAAAESLGAEADGSIFGAEGLDGFQAMMLEHSRTMLAARSAFGTQFPTTAEERLDFYQEHLDEFRPPPSVVVRATPPEGESFLVAYGEGEGRDEHASPAAAAIKAAALGMKAGGPPAEVEVEGGPYRLVCLYRADPPPEEFSRVEASVDFLLRERRFRAFLDVRAARAAVERRPRILGSIRMR